MEVARLTDPDPYRERLRSLLLDPDREPQADALMRLSAAPDVAKLSAPTAILLGKALTDVGRADAAEAILRSAADRNPGDVWVNYELASTLERFPSAREEAVRYYTAARALRPETSHVLAHLFERLNRDAEAEAVFRDLIARRPNDVKHPTCLGRFLADRRRSGDASPVLEQAIAAASAAIRLRPDDANAHADLGLALVHRGKLEEAVNALRVAIRLRPDLDAAHHNLGLALVLRGEDDAAIGEFRAALRLDPDVAETHANLGSALMRQGNHDAAVAECRTAVRLWPNFAGYHIGLGEALMALGHLDEAAAEFRAAIQLKPDSNQAHHGLGLALARRGDLDAAVAEFGAAIRHGSDIAEAHYDLGVTLAQRGEDEAAIAEYREAIRLKPDLAEAHCNLGALLRERGEYAESLAEYRRGHELGSKRPSWRYPSGRWVADAERLAALAERLPAVLKGNDQPNDDAERALFASIAYHKGLYAAATRLYEAAFTSSPELVDEFDPGHHYVAAALAGCGKGKDDPPPDDDTRARLRAKALAWLKADLVACRRRPAAERPRVVQTLNHWKADAHLAGVRDAEALAKLPEEERRAWKALWDEVDAALKALGSP
jgi:tetratricopeptide (TPR) repeat protein